ncbi:hypothetical protein ABPG72_006329 [Tetrahymena utriculariae]
MDVLMYSNRSKFQFLRKKLNQCNTLKANQYLSLQFILYLELWLFKKFNNFVQKAQKTSVKMELQILQKKYYQIKVLFEGLKKTGQQSIELDNAAVIYCFLQQRLSLEHTQQKEKQEITEQQEQNFKKQIEYIKNNQEIKASILNIQQNEIKYSRFFNDIHTDLKLFTKEQVIQNHLNILTKLSYLAKIMPDNKSLVQNIIDTAYIKIDLENKERILENASKIKVDINFLNSNALSKLEPRLMDLISEFFNQVSKLVEIKNLSIYNFILKNSLMAFFKQKRDEMNFQKQQIKDRIEFKIQFLKQQFDQSQLELQIENQNILKQTQTQDKLIDEIKTMKSSVNKYDKVEVNNYNQKIEQLNQNQLNLREQHQKLQKEAEELKHYYLDLLELQTKKENKQKENLIAQYSSQI